MARSARRRPPRPRPRSRSMLVVPDVRGQAYVFAKGILEDAGFAWRVPGARGFAANTVVGQSPLPGTRVVDTGAPLVTLRLADDRGLRAARDAR